MSLNRNIDNWFLGYTRTVHSKSGSLNFGSHRSSKPLKTGTGLTNLRAAALKKPEVMVKIPKRHSKNSKGMKGIRNHADYVSRNGDIPLETQDGEKIQGKQAIKQFLNDWQSHFGIDDETKHKEALNIVLSMPQDTPPDALLQAARDFAAEQFQGHQYFFGLHHSSHNPDEPEHPHVHLCVLMRDERNQRLNPRKNDLFEWRVRFAEKLRENGVDCAATKRVHRGKTQKPENSTLRAMRQRGTSSEAELQQKLAISQAILSGQRLEHPFLNQADKTRQDVVAEYKKIARELYVRGYKTEAKVISKFAQEVSEKGFDTQAQQKFDEMQAFRQSEKQPERAKVDNEMER
ncbi:traS protein [Kingella kingae]|uniref:relaxase/mobilization nuclease domain-containing protein n=1 Tax=Kingella kingae TaxID=504 RepID=UPI00254CCA67|nr:traS protein [Kingella kingae]MDK4528021.1 traS protein [Kingella kingae]MDK4542393.1 traS protein [Kingella kingae]MDK4561800.1 traS protein [Kingella kingae]MDK4579618.1 traS protein [Kingella kingae]MDK4601804.1 traS protein [Kingella kingae]